MNLTVEQIRSIAMGAARVEDQDGVIRLYRFTKEQEEFYKERSQDFYQKSFATSGIRLDFTTNSRTLEMDVEVESGSSRKFFNFDIYRNGEQIGQLGSETENNGRFSGSFDLGEGDKVLRIYCPWSVTAKLLRFSLDDGATVIPSTRPYKMLIYGDSITHGYDALSPSHTYASLLADALNADAYNKGIGAEVFCPGLAEISDDIQPDYISVAYGTNDWSHKTLADLERDGNAFYEALSRRNPQAKIFAITPIWRADWEKETKAGNFFDLPALFDRMAENLPNVTVIHGIDLVPKERQYFLDKFLHPNDEGFAHYFNNLFAEIQKHL